MFFHLSVRPAISYTESYSMQIDVFFRDQASLFSLPSRKGPKSILNQFESKISDHFA